MRLRVCETCRSGIKYVDCQIRGTVVVSRTAREVWAVGHGLWGTPSKGHILAMQSMENDDVATDSVCTMQRYEDKYYICNAETEPDTTHGDP